MFYKHKSMQRRELRQGYHYDDLKIYRPGPSATGGGERCGHCRDVVDRIVESGGVVGTS